MKPNNPFLITGYQSPEYFCDREKETEKIINYLENDWNLTLIAPRRMGKTGLIHHAFYKIKEQNPKISCFYIDIYSTNCMEDFVLLFAKTVLGQIDTLSQSVLKKITSFFKSFRPVITADEMTGSPTIKLEFIDNQIDTSLKEICDYLVQSERRCYIAIDEFQQITEYPEKNMEALLRSYFQFMPNVHFIFSGSKKHVMDEMFVSAKRPFYQSTRILSINEINIDNYYRFANSFFEKKNFHFPKEVFVEIYKSFAGHTWYIQAILNQLYMSRRKNLTPDVVKMAVNTILEEQIPTYQRLFSLLTLNQKELLKAIAKEKSVAEPYSMDFIKKYDLNSPSSIKTTLNSLLNNELVYDNDNKFIVYDRFMSLWLKSL